MSVNKWELASASADSLLTNEECFMLLDSDFFDIENDLLKNFPNAATKIETREWCAPDDSSASLYPLSPPDCKPSRADLANDLLQQLDNQCKQENIFSNWLEEKVEIPIFENIPQVPVHVEVTPVPVATIAPQPTEELLREFESVYGAVELTHLTPPQSPPGPATQLLLSYVQQAQCPAIVPAVPIISNEQWTGTATAVPQYDCDLQEVEDLLRHRASQLTDASSSASPHSSPSSSPRSSSTDEDWGSVSRPKPYSRPADDRRSRKKEQNKNAATRYRQKKKAEVEVLLNEESVLRQRHTDLGNKCSDLQREIRYLKGLMRDLFKAKGLIK